MHRTFIIALLATLTLGFGIGYVSHTPESQKLGSVPSNIAAILERTDLKFNFDIASSTAVGQYRDTVGYTASQLIELPNPNSAINAQQATRVTNWVEHVRRASRATSSPPEDPPR